MERKKKSLLLLLVSTLVLTLALAGCSNQEVVGNIEEHDHDHEHHDDHDYGHAHGKYEWIGEYELKAGRYLFHFGASEDETMDVGFIKMGDNIKDLAHHAAHLMASEKEFIKQDSEFEAKPDYAYTLEMDKEHGHIYFTIKEAGVYAIVTEHLPSESNMQIFDENEVEILPIKEHEAEDHHHDH